MSDHIPFALEHAIAIAAKAHQGQADKGGLPYILHPLAVMLSMPKEDYDGQIVAVLHDVVEDTEVRLDDLREWLAEHLVDAVEAITKREGETNREYWARCRGNAIAARVKIADMKHNSSVERISVLPYDQQEYLCRKYAEALEYFGEPRMER